jgi:predicted protein tyrosine phosphatase
MATATAATDGVTARQGQAHFAEAINDVDIPPDWPDPTWIVEQSAAYTIRGAIASQITRDGLWLGRGEFALSADLMARAGITHVLTVANDTPGVVGEMKRRAAIGELSYLSLGVGDFGTDAAFGGISRFFAEAFAFLDAALKDEKGSVFVHCANGSNRSPTMVVGYMMRSRGLSLESALRWVLRRRPHIQPLPDNLAELNTFARAGGGRAEGADEKGGVAGEGADRVLPAQFQSMKKKAKRAWRRAGAAGDEARRRQTKRRARGARP